MTKFEFQVEENFTKTRLEDYLCEKFPNLSKMYLRERVRDEKCEVNGIAENRGFRLKQNDFVEIFVDLDRETAMKPEAIPLEIVFEDEELLVVNKPAGMLVHPTHRDKNGTLLNALSYYLNAERGMRNAELKSEEQKKNELKDDKTEKNHSAFSVPHSAFVRPGLVHRLDKKTSGLMVVSKTARAHRILAEHFRRKLVEKKYLALVEGVFEKDSGVIVAPIGRFAELKYWDVKIDGKHSETRFQVRKRFSDMTLLELEPVTGRTNQLRIHCAHVGHPIAGDTERGGRDFSRLCLHAYKLSFWHPNGGERLEFETKMRDEKIFDL
jgi:23S rRNA pseudouridine1911/1915/1917 synthase